MIIRLRLCLTDNNRYLEWVQPCVTNKWQQQVSFYTGNFQKSIVFIAEKSKWRVSFSEWDDSRNLDDMRARAPLVWLNNEWTWIVEGFIRKFMIFRLSLGRNRKRSIKSWRLSTFQASTHRSHTINYSNRKNTHESHEWKTLVWFESFRKHCRRTTTN